MSWTTYVGMLVRHPFVVVVVFRQGWLFSALLSFSVTVYLYSCRVLHSGMSFFVGVFFLDASVDLEILILVVLRTSF